METWKCQSCRMTNANDVLVCEGCGEYRTTAILDRNELLKKLHAATTHAAELWEASENSRHIADSYRHAVPLARAIDIAARLAMEPGTIFTGASGDFDACSNLTRQKYEERAAQAFGLTLDEYYKLGD